MPKQPPSALEKATRLLTAKSRSSAELRRRLVQAGFETPEIDAALDQLSLTGFLNDESFARQFARSRLSSGKRSTRRVRDELRTKGLGADLVAGAMDDVVADEAFSDADAALTLARKKAPALRGLDRQVARRRLYGMLARRGFSPDVIARAVVTALGSEAQPVDETDESPA
ncbi:MAG: recombination regulator RecX [Gemmatimonadaceae bacterium]|nr:recombination regulator RecX [Gemmatimonadaceae bacterium]